MHLTITLDKGHINALVADQLLALAAKLQGKKRPGRKPKRKGAANRKPGRPKKRQLDN